MTTAQHVDQLLGIISCVLPILAVVVIRNPLISILLGTISSWIILGSASCWIHEFDSEYNPTSVSNTLWLLVGWIPALIYATIIWSVKNLILQIKKRRREKQNASEPPPLG